MNSLEDIDIDKLVKIQKLDEIHSAFMFVSAAGYGENNAILDKQSGKFFLHSDLCDMEEQLPEKDYDSAIHIEIPHKNDLNLGQNLVFEFMEQFIPEKEDQIEQIFRRKGAYSRYKDLLHSIGLLEKWYDFENKRELVALLQWCKENDINIKD